MLNGQVPGIMLSRTCRQKETAPVRGLIRSGSGQSHSPSSFIFTHPALGVPKSSSGSKPW